MKFLISNFSSVFELAVAFYLAFSMFYSVKDNYFRNYLDHLDYVRSFQDRIKEDDVEDYVKAIASVDRVKIESNIAAQPKIRFSIYCSIFFALTSLTALILSGFNPSYQISLLYMYALLSIIIIAAPLMIWNLSRTLKPFKKEFQVAHDNLHKTFIDGLG